MKSTILISRIMRVIETEGAVGEGATLAEEYSAAVRQVNSRLEAVQTAIDAKQVSDAVRMMEDAPRLLDEVGTLDFNQLPDWDVLCARNNWAPPLKLDKALLERVLMLNESTEVVEPFLRMYRRAVRTNNNKLAVQSLRRLVQIDHSQNWKVNLVQAEEAVQKQLVSDFRAAKTAGSVEEMDRLAQELVETNWSEPPASKGTEEIRSYIVEKEAKQRNVEGAEDVSIIRRCMSENWNRPLAFSMLQAVDGLVEKGFVLPVADRDVVDSCRRRCADEMEAEEKERRWKDLCEQLHAAIQQENTTSIRDVLSAPEFLDREPDPDLIKQAQLVIQHEEAARKRKMMQIAVCAMATLLAVLGVSGWWLKQKLFNDRCEGEAVKLAALQKGSHAVDRLTEALRKLQTDDPDVYSDPRVNVFDGKLKTMRSQMNARTNEIAVVLSELKALKEAKWGDSVDSVTSRIERINAIIAKDDDALRADFIAIKAAWADHCEEMDVANRNVATKFHETLISHVKVIADRLKSELISEGLAKEVASCKESIEEWKRVHAQHVPSLEGAVGEAEKSLGEAENTQHNLQEAIKRLKDSATAKDYLAARKTLVEFYSGYPFVKAIGSHPVTAEDAAAVVDGSSAEQKAYETMLKIGVDDATFKAFIADNVASLTEFPSYYSLYGIANRDVKVVSTANNNNGDDFWSANGVSGEGSYYGRNYYFAMCKGKPEIKKPSYDAAYQIDGELLDFAKGAVVQQMSRKARPEYYSFAGSEEIKGIVDVVGRSNLTITMFEQEVVKRIDEHLQVAAAADYLKWEVDVYGKQNGFLVKRYPAIRRVQMLQLYFTWLKDDLKLMPKDGAVARWFDKVESLAQPVRVDNIPEDLTWTCMRENRVRQRNSECAKLLSQMAAQKFIDEYRAWKSARIELRKLTDWKIEYAGCNSYNPYDTRWVADHSAVLPSILGNVKKDHPLYVLRRENEKLILKRALVPYKNGTMWAIASGMAKEFVTGDPLFQVSAGGKYIDAEETIEGILKEIPETTAKQFAAKIPLFKVEVR